MKSVHKDMKYPEILAHGAFGVQWRGNDVPKPIAVDKDNFVAQFGFTCAFCGGSGVNQDPIQHVEPCGRNTDQNYLSFHNPRRK